MQALTATGVAPSGEPFAQRTKRVLGLALREAMYPGHDYTGTEHNLPGLLAEGGGVRGALVPPAPTFLSVTLRR